MTARKARTAWTSKHDLILEEWSGRIAARVIAGMTGHTERTVLEKQRTRNLPAFHPQRVGWSRRDYLLASAAGLWESVA